ncbi:MAG: hypothetical protein QE271_03295 [Bacteriovoracaceae bacterium]|nr:hypothetical protein [Bacteriovoracaceae bacterium]
MLTITDIVESNLNGIKKKYVLKESHTGDIFIQNMQNSFFTGKWLKIFSIKQKFTFEIPEIYDLFIDYEKQSAYMLMEYIEGETIAEYIKSSRNHSTLNQFAQNLLTDSRKLSQYNGMLLDINSDNIIHANHDGNFYLVDTGLLSRNTDLAKNPEQLFGSWQTRGRYQCEDFLRMFGVNK